MCGRGPGRTERDPRARVARPRSRAPPAAVVASRVSPARRAVRRGDRGRSRGSAGRSGRVPRDAPADVEHRLSVGRAADALADEQRAPGRYAQEVGVPDVGPDRAEGAPVVLQGDAGAVGQCADQILHRSGRREFPGQQGAGEPVAADAAALRAGGEHRLHPGEDTDGTAQMTGRLLVGRAGARRKDGGDRLLDVHAPVGGGLGQRGMGAAHVEPLAAGVDRDRHPGDGPNSCWPCWTPGSTSSAARPGPISWSGPSATDR